MPTVATAEQRLVCLDAVVATAASHSYDATPQRSNAATQATPLGHSTLYWYLPSIMSGAALRGSQDLARLATFHLL